MSNPTFDFNAVHARLTDWVVLQLPSAQNITLSALKRPGAGISNETYFFDLKWTQHREVFEKHLVVRWPPTGFAAFPRHAYDMGQ